MTTPCDEIPRARLLALAADDHEALSADERRAAETHLGRCDTCRERVAAFRHVRGVLREAARPRSDDRSDERTDERSGKRSGAGHDLRGRILGAARDAALHALDRRIEPLARACEEQLTHDGDEPVAEDTREALREVDTLATRLEGLGVRTGLRGLTALGDAGRWATLLERLDPWRRAVPVGGSAPASGVPDGAAGLAVAEPDALPDALEGLGLYQPSAAPSFLDSLAPR